MCCNSVEQWEPSELRGSRSVLRAAVGEVPRAYSPLRGSTEVKYAFIVENRDIFSVTLMCEVLDISKSGFHSWSKRDHETKAKKRLELVNQITEIHQISRRNYGSPRILQELKALDIPCGKGKLERLMKAEGISAKTKKKFKITTDSKHGLPVAKNLLDRNFEAGKPNSVWLADITYIWTREGWMYLAAVLDLGTRKIVGWSMKERMKEDLVLDALDMAFKRQKPPRGLMHHSDQGSQYAGHAYAQRLWSYGMIASMSRRGQCWDNAPMESFFHSLKTEHVYFEEFATRNEAKESIFEWIEVYYNRQRIHSTLGYQTPECYEQLANGNHS